VLLLLLLGCPSGGAKVDSADSTDAWPEWEEEGADATDSPPIVSTTDENDDPGLCEPVACIELAEAVDRGFATIAYGGWGLEVENRGPYPICFESWYTFLSSTSQDAVAGTTGVDEIAPGDGMTLPYADWGADTTAWWCVEHNQYTSAGASYDFNGARAPTRIGGWTQEASDEDSDSVEDHRDAHADDELPQTQHNLWDYIAEAPVFVVGRQVNWFEVNGGQTVNVTVQVTNLGRVSGAGRVTERLPAGWVASSASPEPESNLVDGAGVQTLTWLVEAGAAVEPADTTRDTDYDEVELRYRLTYVGECAGRELGFAPTLLWADGTGGAYVSEGAPMVLQCCGDDDGFGIGGGFPP
jgi:hypothetical protein